MERIINFLGCRTPDVWLVTATQQLELLLQDHAYCEKKAASTAINLMFRYPQHARLLHVMSRLAREELRHFEQVLQILQQRGISFRQQKPGNYAKSLHQHCSAAEPARLIDQLIIGAIIEARSCERFAALVAYLPTDLADFYTRLVKAEARHFEVYLALAETIAETDIMARIDYFITIEQALILQPEADFRFHSGPPLSSNDNLDVKSTRIIT